MTTLLRSLVTSLPRPLVRAGAQVVATAHDARAAARRRRRPADGRVLPDRGPRVSSRVVESFDAFTVADETLSAVTAALSGAGIGAVVLPRRVGGRRVVAVSADDAARVAGALAPLADEDAWFVQERRGPRTVRRPLASWARSGASTDGPVVLFRALAAPTGLRLAGDELGVRLEAWQRVTSDDVERPVGDGGTFVRGTYLAPAPNGSFAYLEPHDWDAAVAATGKAPVAPAHLVEVTEPIDVVYTWVDSQDPAWRARLGAARDGADLTALHRTASSSSRFTSRDELRYSLRSIEMYASWVRRVFIVTDGQVPAWLDTGNPRVQVVDHAEIFRDPSVLPVFNSHAIESQLHHIEGLAEQYLYLNDDFFFGRPVRPETFFEGNGNTRFFPSQNLLDLAPRSSRDEPVLSAAKQNRALIEATFGRTFTQKLHHVPMAQRRSVLTEMEDRFPELFDAVSRSRFRNPDDYSIPSSLSHYYAYATGRAVVGEIDCEYVTLASPTLRHELAYLAVTRGADVFCLNDTFLDKAQHARALRLLGEFLPRYFPLRSAFEKADRNEQATGGQ